MTIDYAVVYNAVLEYWAGAVEAATPYAQTAYSYAITPYGLTFIALATFLTLRYGLGHVAKGATLGYVAFGDTFGFIISLPGRLIDFLIGMVSHYEGSVCTDFFYAIGWYPGVVIGSVLGGLLGSVAYLLDETLTDVTDLLGYFFPAVSRVYGEFQAVCRQCCAWVYGMKEFEPHFGWQFEVGKAYNWYTNFDVEQRLANRVANDLFLHSDDFRDEVEYFKWASTKNILKNIFSVSDPYSQPFFIDSNTGKPFVKPRLNKSGVLYEESETQKDGVEATIIKDVWDALDNITGSRESTLSSIASSGSYKSLLIKLLKSQPDIVNGIIIMDRPTAASLCPHGHIHDHNSILKWLGTYQDRKDDQKTLHTEDPHDRKLLKKDDIHRCPELDRFIDVLNTLEASPSFTMA